MNESGIIGSSGKWYECDNQCHFPTVMIVASKNPSEHPFVLCRNEQLAWSAVPPNRAQFETVNKAIKEIASLSA